MPDISPHDYILGFDFGTKRIGCAVGTRDFSSSTPLGPLSAVNGVPKWEAIANLVEKWTVKALVVGLPFRLDDGLQNTSFKARRFANKLSSRVNLPAYLIDERFTTAEAKRQIHEGKLPFDVDSYSAKLILDAWLQSEESTWVRSN